MIVLLAKKEVLIVHTVTFVVMFQIAVIMVIVNSSF